MNRRNSSAKNDWQLTIYIPQALRALDPIARLQRAALSQRRSMNFLAVEALLGYLERLEREGERLEDMSVSSAERCYPEEVTQSRRC